MLLRFEMWLKWEEMLPKGGQNKPLIWVRCRLYCAHVRGMLQSYKNLEEKVIFVVPPFQPLCKYMCVNMCNYVCKYVMVWDGMGWYEMIWNGMRLYGIESIGCILYSLIWENLTDWATDWVKKWLLERLSPLKLQNTHFFIHFCYFFCK